MEIITKSRFIALALCLVWAVAPAAADSARPQPFNDSTLAPWQQRSFVGNSTYQLTTDKGVRVLKGSAKAQASLLYKEQGVSLEQTPLLSWHWKVNNVFSDTNEQSRDGDDFQARIYVVHKYGLLPWQSYAINYVWASHTPQGQAWNSPYTRNSKLIAIQSGDTQAGKWLLESRNVAADFKQLFNVNVETLDGIAIMVDADNTGQYAEAHFGAIEFSSE